MCLYAMLLDLRGRSGTDDAQAPVLRLFCGVVGPLELRREATSAL